MQFLKRKFVKFLGFSIFLTIYPVRSLFASAKKVINPNLSKKQRDIMFNEVLKDPFQVNY